MPKGFLIKSGCEPQSPYKRYPNRLPGQREIIIKNRIDDGQLDDCPLTLDELNKIKGTVDGNTGMLPVLRGIYHIRIEYPDDPGNPSSS